MADKETGLNISVNAEANEASAAKAAKDLEKKVNNSVKGGRITVPVDITVPIDKDKDKLSQAQSEVVKKIRKLTSKGFSASGKDIDDLNSKFENFTKELDRAGKGRQNKIFKEIRKQVETLEKQYQELKTTTNSTKTYTSKTSSTKKSTNKPPKERYLDQQEEYSRRAQGAGKRAELTKELDYVRKNKSPIKSSGDIKLGMVNDDLLKLGEYSIHGSKWATELAKILKEEVAKAARTLVTYIDPSYKKRTKDGRQTTEREYLTDAVKDVRKKLKSSIAQLEAGNEDITLDTLKEQAAIIKVLNKELGKTTEDTEKAISSALQKRYSDSEIKRINGTWLEEGQEKGVGSGHANTQKLIAQLYDVMKQWDSEVIADTIAKEIALNEDKASKKSKKLSEIDKLITNTKASDSYKIELDKLNGTIKDVFSEIGKTNSTIETQTNYDKIEHSAERVADSAEAKKNTDIVTGIQKDLDTGFNTDAKADTLIDAVRRRDGSGGNGGLGGNNDLNGTGPNILEQMRDLLISINAYTTAIFDLLPKLKLTIKREKRSKKSKNTEDIASNISRGIAAKDFLGQSMEINKVWDDIAGQFEGWIKPIREALLPVTASRVTDRTDEAFEAIKKAGKRIFIDKTDPAKLRRQQAINEVEQAREDAIEKNKKAEYMGVDLSQDTSDLTKGLKNIIKKAFGMVSSSAEVTRIKNLNQQQREKELAERRQIYGIADTNRNAAATGDKARAFRTKSLYNYRQKDNNPFKDLKLTSGLNVDTKGITEALQTMIEKNMFGAQTGAKSFMDIVKLSFGGIGMPSLEKSRAQADAANEILSIIRQAVQELLQSIQDKETNLRGMESSGYAKFDAEGKMVSGTNEAWTLFAQLEESKTALNGIISEMGMMDQLSEATGGNMEKFFKVLAFLSPELRKCNNIISNINVGLDKNGKALKYQKRIQETLNYSFQLLTRHVGQILKNWMMMLNPINLIKKAFSDFASYDVKWQRTMNVIKYNLRRIVRPMMEWIAQQIVNIIGLVNSLIKGVGKILGYNWDLFDQAAANTEKMHEELEAAANVSAGFDELHDIGSDNSAANDLMGDIYTPQWEGLNNFLEGIGEKIGKIIDTVSHWNFWNWLALAGAALAGFLALKWLIGLFTGGSNPLQTVAKGFSFLEKTVGWALLIWAFTAFTKALTDFIECMKTASWEDIKRSLTMLGGAIAEIVVAFVLLQAATKFLGGGNWLNSLGIAAIVTSFALLTAAFAYFFDTVKSMSSDQLMTALGALAIGLALVGAAVIALLIALTAIISTGVGAVAIVALAAILAAIAAVIAAMALFVTAVGTYSNQLIAVIQAVGETITSIIQAIANGISLVISTVVVGIVLTIQTIGNTIVNIIMGIAEGIQAVLEPILDFIDDIIEKIIGLAETIAHEIGETIRTIIETVGKIITDIITSLINAIPTLLNAILNFCNKIGPAIENSADAIMRTITKVINFTVSAIEYLVNLVVGGVNQMISAINSVSKYVGINIPRVPEVSIPRFVPKYEKGTNYVPSDGLAYLHQGEAVIPKKYNQPYSQGMSAEERLYMKQMMNTMRSLDDTMKQGITVNGQFIQRGSDLVAVVNRTKSQTGADLLSNVAYAR